MIEANEAPPRATAVIVIGMAGSGKSTFVARLAAHMAKKAAEARSTKGDRTESNSQTETAKDSIADAESSTRSLPTRPYLLNIDPAVASGPFITTINDIISMLIYFGLATAFMSYLI